MLKISNFQPNIYSQNIKVKIKAGRSDFSVLFYYNYNILCSRWVQQINISQTFSFSGPIFNYNSHRASRNKNGAFLLLLCISSISDLSQPFWKSHRCSHCVVPSFAHKCSLEILYSEYINSLFTLVMRRIKIEIIRKAKIFFLIFLSINKLKLSLTKFHVK